MLNHLKKMVLLVACPFAIVVGSWILSDYSYRPGAQGDVVTDLKSIDEIREATADELDAKPGSTTLVLFYHPHCPCTNATIRNLERLYSRLRGQTNFVAFGYCPSEKPDSWISSPMTSAIKRLDAKIVVDPDGQNCARFGVVTSGHILVYDDTGQLLFSGGITPSRGHEGNCLASEGLIQAVKLRTEETVNWPVYGCPIVLSDVPQP